ncbi:sensor domain-containing diguanylate cyclase [Gallaecimonas sp. GXIMD4217]|uniref:sensor domain-containing diguanylate cyclase n=1 Tax=Gallaecimonas sp. GXIMD4217 TaxID=3131927 RepID=UPI00311AE600
MIRPLPSLSQNEQLQAENARLRRIADDAREKLDAALDGTGLCLWQLDVPTGKLVIFNRRWGSMLGYQPGEISAHFDEWKARLHPDDAEEVLSAFYDHLHGRSSFYQVVHRMIGKDGKLAWVVDRGRVVERDDNGKPLRVMGTHMDITQEKLYQEKLARLAHQDPLTGLDNRLKLQQHFEQAQSRPHWQPFSLIFLDLDDFKGINDDLGHKAGDELLVQIGRRLRQACGQALSVARLGGDEFVLLLPQAGSGNLLVQVESIFDRSFLLDGDEVLIGVSLGMTTIVEPDIGFEQAMNSADMAMYDQKRLRKRG